MDIIDEIEKRLAKYPSAKYENLGNQITIFPESDQGFLIGLTVDDCYTVNFDGWHEEFTTPEDALGCVAFGLSKECRLKESSRGQWDYKWTVESKTEAGWDEESTTALFFYPFWRQKKERYLQNHLIK